MRSIFPGNRVRALAGVIAGLAASAVSWADTSENRPPKLRVGDTVHVDVVGEVITGDYKVSPTGTFQMQYLDDPVPAAGKTTKELEDTLMAMLKPDYLLDPQIIVTLIDKKKESCMVLGQVASPRLIQFDPDEGLTLQQALGQAGDVTDAANVYRIEITRGEESIVAPMPASKAMRIFGGDTINVPKLPPLGTYKLTGHVRSVGSYEIPAGPRRSVMWAIINGGGVADTGTLNRVELRRGDEVRTLKGEKELEAELVKPDDLIRINRRFF